MGSKLPLRRFPYFESYYLPNISYCINYNYNENMKRIILISLICSSILLFGSCATKSANGAKNSNSTASIESAGKGKNSSNFVTVEAGKAIISNIDSDKGIQYGKTVDGFDNVTVVDCGKTTNRYIGTVDLSDYEDMELDVIFECDMKIVDSTNAENDIIWMINEFDAGFPEIDRKKVASGEWVHFAGKKTVPLSGKRQFYISTTGINKNNIKIYIKEFKLTVFSDSIGKEKVIPKSWTEEPSLAEAYKPYFDYFGFATPLSMLNSYQVIDGLPMQASCITMENEFKPDFMFAWQKPSNLKEFVAEDGKTYMVPGNTPVFTSVDKILTIAKHLGIQMRGHVLVWHSQTPDWFFRENYGDTKANFVDADTMNARLEWYIKTILEHITEWENANNNGKRIVTTWDVVNEAASDGATKTAWLRTDSNWYRVYKSDLFIVNAFRYANRYAPKDVKLAYNDYGCASPTKSDAICKIIDAIQAAPDARIDIAGMQTHVGMNTPVTGPNSFENSVKKFLAKGIDVQITEMDIGQDGQRYNSEHLKSKYKEFFKMFLNNRKTEDKNGICGITLWGIVDERSWIYNNGGVKQHPLLFEADFVCKPAFYGVLEAAQEFD